LAPQAVTDDPCSLWVMEHETLRGAHDAAAGGEPVDDVLLRLLANSDLDIYEGEQ
jgi:hypothetical protein